MDFYRRLAENPRLVNPCLAAWGSPFRREAAAAVNGHQALGITDWPPGRAVAAAEQQDDIYLTGVFKYSIFCLVD